LIATFQNNKAKSKHKKLCRKFAQLHGEDFQSSAFTAVLIRRKINYANAINSLCDFVFAHCN